MDISSMIQLKALHVGISVYNMDESIVWYEKNLGFHFLRDDGFVPGLGARICFLERDGFQLELFAYMEPKRLPTYRMTPNSDLQTVGTKHVAFQVSDMNAMKRHLLENGVEIAHEVIMDKDHVVFIKDCNGVLIELLASQT